MSRKSKFLDWILWIGVAVMSMVSISAMLKGDTEIALDCAILASVYYLIIEVRK
jgi:hypothetical protein